MLYIWMCDLQQLDRKCCFLASRLRCKLVCTLLDRGGGGGKRGKGAWGELIGLRASGQRWGVGKGRGAGPWGKGELGYMLLAKGCVCGGASGGRGGEFNALHASGQRWGGGGRAGGG